MLLITTYVMTLIPIKIKDAIDLLHDSTTTAPLIQDVALVIIGLAVILVVTRTLSRLLIFIPARFVEYDLRNDVYRKLMGFSEAYFRGHLVGDLMSRVINDIQSLRLMSAMGVLHVVNTIVIYIFVFYQMSQIHLRLSILVIIPIPIALILVRFFAGRLYKYMGQSQKKLGSMTHFFVESLGHLLTLKSYGVESAILDRFSKENKAYLRVSNQLAATRSIMFPFIAILGSLGNLILFYVGGKYIITGDLSVGGFVAMSAYIALLSWPTASLAWMINIVGRGMVALERVNDILGHQDDTLPTVHSPPITHPPKLELKNLTFTFPEDVEPILVNMSVTIPAGSSLGIFGPTGSGKTVLSRLLTRREVALKGQYAINDIDSHEVSLTHFRQACAYVSQQPFLFSDTIAENIGYGHLGALLHRDDDRIRQCAKFACVDRDIHTFPKGYETLIGEKGIILSGGQKSRVGFSRALYKSHHLLVLDDILSAVDHKTEAEILTELFNTQHPSTKVIISHRISALTRCDHIIVLDHGHIVAEGSHTELIAKVGLYQDTWRYQRLSEGNPNV